MENIKMFIRFVISGVGCVGLSPIIILTTTGFGMFLIIPIVGAVGWLFSWILPKDSKFDRDESKQMMLSIFFMLGSPLIAWYQFTRYGETTILGDYE